MTCICRDLRLLPLCVVLAACASSGGGSAGAAGLVPAGDPMPILRVVYRQFYENSRPFVMENLGGRDLVALRSRPLAAGEPPVAYVPDEIMRVMLEEFERAGLPEFLRPRPPDPAGLGAVAELTIVYPGGRTRCFLRARGTADPAANKAYELGYKNFLAVWNHHRPYAQVSAGDEGAFGVERAGHGRR